MIARRAGDTWYIAGINATESDKTLTLDLSFAGSGAAQIIADGEAVTGSPASFSQRSIAAGTKAVVTIKPRGGFVITKKQ